MSMLPTSLPGQTDHELIDRIRAGDQVGWEELFRRHRAMAYRVAYRLLGNDSDALDAVQDGFANILLNIHRFCGESSFKTWLLRIVTNAALDIGRSRQRRDGRFANAEDLPPVADRNPGPDYGLECEDIRRVVQEALDSLPEAQRQTFVLFVEGDLSYREIADILGISIGTVMSRLFYARQRLKSSLNVGVLV